MEVYTLIPVPKSLPPLHLYKMIASPPQAVRFEFFPSDTPEKSLNPRRPAVTAAA